LAKAFVQSTLSAAAELANAWLPPQNLSACSGIDKITVSWDKSGDFDLYKIYRNDKFIDMTIETFYVDSNVEIGEKYEYYVKALSCEYRNESAPSNKDEVLFVEPIPLPYSNNFSGNKYGFEHSDWVLKTISGKSALCNTKETVSFPDNYLAVAESDWFAIPDDIENVSIRFKWQGELNGIWHNAGLYFEVTNDRKTWHKLAYISGNQMGWKNCGFSLNNYKDCDFVQVRFRLESSGSLQYTYPKIGYITDVDIAFDADTTRIKENLPYISTFNFSPNPASTYINIVTSQYEPYNISIYDMTGKLIFAQGEFQNGMLNVSQLKSGNYFIVASTKQHRVAKKLVIQ
jgi:hypothetical protein